MDGRCSRKNGQIKFYDFINGPRCPLAPSLSFLLFHGNGEGGRGKGVN